MRFILAATAVFAFAGAANAAVLFSDDFDAETPRLGETVSLANWEVLGNVDVVDAVNVFGITGISGRAVDLDGTTGPGGISTAPIAFNARGKVRVQFDLSGSQRGGAGDEYYGGVFFILPTDIAGGTFSLPGGAGVEGPVADAVSFAEIAFVAGNSPWTSYFLEFRPQEAGSFRLGFGTFSEDNVGPLLDNVLVTQTAIPEPATWAMMIAGFGLVGVAARRRRTGATT